MYLDHHINRISYVSNVSRHLIRSLLIFVFMGVCLDISAQTKKTTAYKAPNFGCTFEDGPFKAKIIATQNSLSKNKLDFLTSVDIQGCQVIHIVFDKIEKGFVATFKPTDIDDSGNAIIHADRGITYEIHLVLP
jgi:hypothetical protein